MTLQNKFKVQTAHKFNGKLPKSYQVEYKLDGVRAVLCWNADNKSLTLRSRTGKLIYSSHLNSIDLNSLSSFKLDGELIVGSGKITDRQIISGLVNSAMHGGDLNLIRSCCFKVFDCFDSFCEDNLLTKRQHIGRYLVELLAEHINIEFVKPLDCVGIEAIQALANERYEKGFEGLMIKDKYAKYTKTRSRSWLKVKATYETTGIVVGTTAGKGKYEHATGAAIVRLTEDVNENNMFIAKGTEVTVGSGLYDFDRTNIHLIGLQADISFSGLVTNSVSVNLYQPRINIRYNLNV